MKKLSFLESNNPKGLLSFPKPQSIHVQKENNQNNFPLHITQIIQTKKS